MTKIVKQVEEYKCDVCGEEITGWEYVDEKHFHTECLEKHPQPEILDEKSLGNWLKEEFHNIGSMTIADLMDNITSFRKPAEVLDVEALKDWIDRYFLHEITYNQNLIYNKILSFRKSAEAVGLDEEKLREEIVKLTDSVVISPLNHNVNPDYWIEKIKSCLTHAPQKVTAEEITNWISEYKHFSDAEYLYKDLSNFLKEKGLME
mgnify:CR=1 FL=1